MERDYLQLKDGRIGRLKKGMTVSAHFMVTRRSLFALLYQKMDSWVNPRQYINENKDCKIELIEKRREEKKQKYVSERSENKTA